MDYFWAILLLLALVAGWLLTLFSLPGNWLMVAAAALYAWLVPPESPVQLEWGWVAALVVLALLGEALELLAGALGAKRGGGSKRGMALAIVGSVVGSIAGAFIGLPIPIVGSVIAAVLFAALGALGGAMLGEHWKGRTLDESWKVGQGAFWGRLLGTVAKISIGTTMAVLTVVGIVWPS